MIPTAEGPGLFLFDLVTVPSLFNLNSEASPVLKIKLVLHL
jgi:hypothetical protein